MSSDTRPLLEYSNVTVRKNEKNVLDSISLNIDVGENVAIIGPNGSGKSSLIKTITRDYYPLAGTDGLDFRIMGKDVWDLFEMRHFLGIVSYDLQEDYVRDVSGLDAVISGFFSSIGLYPNHQVSPEMNEKARELLEFLGISYLSDKNMSEMSTGEARRVLIARALVHDPQTLVLDEPSNSLDMRSRHVFREALRKVASSGKNIILVTHDLEDIIPEIGRVIFLKDGKVFLDGPKEDILTAKNLSELFNMHVEVACEKGYYRTWIDPLSL
ncbi:molybdenum ABC transporter ATP-binding protein [Methanococcoides methylutens]|uniref:Molybdenum ABC transporter ATP-binding protein n=1 Tax=Methanococcoides methylutens TaxID=2226 RepID=A0A099T538_METMT|nr:ATP-binding cassette domain-containing protein [Methanococcoides methylutens]KGK99316.1 molybdenum ABC transporter ATP-binding protein [Methanococcoides methylutens]